MIPLFFLLGFKTMEEFMVSVGLTQNTALQPMRYSDYKITPTLLQVIGATEGISNKAYKLSGETRYTIGFGSTYLYTKTGQNFRGTASVLASDTLSTLKVQMGYSNLSDIDFAYQLKINHILFDYSMKKYKALFSDLDKYKVPYNESIAISLIDFNYNSGSGLQGVYYVQILNGLIQAKGDLRKIASIIAQVRYTYLKSLNAFAINSHGWLKRVYYACYRIFDNSLTYKTVDNSFGGKNNDNKLRLIKAFRDNLGVIITY